ncbi:hypothetical protein GCM10028805_50070 [Spirosoma harenae]
MDSLSTSLLLLLIINLGIAFGAGIYEARLTIPQWLSKSALSGYQVNNTFMNELDPGRKFWSFVTTGPLTLITLANLFVAWSSPQPIHTWWLAAVFITLLERLGTFTFFIPTAIKLLKADQLPASHVNRLAMLWINLNYVRNALTMMAWLVALYAFGL